jgi:hypothetical protein
MQFEQVTPEKLLNFLKSRSEELEKEIEQLRQEFYTAVEAEEYAEAKGILSMMIRRNDEYAAIYTEYATGKEYVETLKQIAEEDKDRPVN